MLSYVENQAGKYQLNKFQLSPSGMITSLIENASPSCQAHVTVKIKCETK